MRYQVESVHSVDSGSPGGALRAFLEDLLVGGRPVDFLVREIGGRGGGVVRLRVSSAGVADEEPRSPSATLTGVSRTIELDRDELLGDLRRR